MRGVDEVGNREHKRVTLQLGSVCVLTLLLADFDVGGDERVSVRSFIFKSQMSNDLMYEFLCYQIWLSRAHRATDCPAFNMSLMPAPRTAPWRRTCDTRPREVAAGLRAQNKIYNCKQSNSMTEEFEDEQYHS
jgi:hypothetical protein